MDVLNSRETEVESFYFNLKDLERYWSSQTRAYHHTAPISMTYALREALRMMMEEGVDNQIQRHARVAASLRSGLEALGLELLAHPEHRLNRSPPSRCPRASTTPRYGGCCWTTTTSKSAAGLASTGASLGASA